MVKNGRLVSSAQEFGEGWSLGRRNHGCEKAPSPPVDSTVSTCFSRLRVYWRAHKRCWPIKKQFSNCHKFVKPNAFFWACISDVCQCSGRRCECEALMAYARECRRQGVTMNWGRKNTCGRCSKLTHGIGFFAGSWEFSLTCFRVKFCSISTPTPLSP